MNWPTFLKREFLLIYWYCEWFQCIFHRSYYWLFKTCVKLFVFAFFTFFFSVHQYSLLYFVFKFFITTFFSSLKNMFNGEKFSFSISFDPNFAGLHKYMPVRFLHCYSRCYWVLRFLSGACNDKSADAKWLTCWLLRNYLPLTLFCAAMKTSVCIRLHFKYFYLFKFCYQFCSLVYLLCCPHKIVKPPW